MRYFERILAALESTRFDWDSDTVTVLFMDDTPIEVGGAAYFDFPDSDWIRPNPPNLRLDWSFGLDRSFGLAPNQATGLLISDLTTDGPFYSEAEDWLLDSWLEEHDDGM